MSITFYFDTWQAYPIKYIYCSIINILDTGVNMSANQID